MHDEKPTSLFREKFKRAQERKGYSRPAPSYRAIFFFPTIVMALTLVTVVVAAATVKYVPIVWVAANTEDRMERYSIGVPIKGFARIENMAVYEGKAVNPGSPLAYLKLERDATAMDQTDISRSKTPLNSRLSESVNGIAVVESTSHGEICGHTAQRGDYVKDGQELATVCVKGSKRIYSSALSPSQFSNIALGDHFRVRITTWRGKADISSGLVLDSVTPKYAEDGTGIRHVLLKFHPTQEFEAKMAGHTEVVDINVAIAQEETSIGRWMMSRMGMFASGQRQ